MYRAYCTLIMDRFIHLQPTPTIIYEGGLTMNKPTRMKILAFLLVFGMVAAFLPACAEEPAPPTPTPTTEPTQPTEPQPADASVLLGKIDNTVLTDETFFEILGYVDELIAESQQISVPLNEKLVLFCLANNKMTGDLASASFEVEDTEMYTVLKETNSLLMDMHKHADSPQVMDKIRYILMTYCLTEEYQGRIACQFDGGSHGRPRICYMMYIFPSFSTSGYATIGELATAVWNEEIPAPEDAYYVASCVHWVRNIAARRDVEIFPEEK